MPADDYLADYSIHHFEPLNLLIAHMRYIGPKDEYESKMDEIAADENTQRWWKVRLVSVPSLVSTLSPCARLWIIQPCLR